MAYEESRKLVRDNATDIADLKFTSPRWDISQERAFVETVAGQRTNFLLVFFGLVLAAAINLRETPILSAFILSIGASIAYLLSEAVLRAHEKLNIILELIFLDPAHPATVVHKIANPKRRRNSYIYIGVSLICRWVLILLAVLAWVISIVMMSPHFGAC